MSIALRLAGIITAIAAIVTGFTNGRTITSSAYEGLTRTDSYGFHIMDALVWWIGGLSLGLGLYALGVLLDKLDHIQSQNEVFYGALNRMEKQSQTK